MAASLGDLVTIGVAHPRQRGIVALNIIANRDAETQSLSLLRSAGNDQKWASATREIVVGHELQPTLSEQLDHSLHGQ